MVDAPEYFSTKDNDIYVVVWATLKLPPRYDKSQVSYPALRVSKIFVISKWHLTGAPELPLLKRS
jgi:hypothetical protein